MELLWWTLVREHGGSFSKVGDESLFSVIVFSQLAAVLSDKGPPTQLHALPPFIEITPALMNSNLLPRVSAPEPWQGIIHLVRSLARFFLSNHKSLTWGSSGQTEMFPGCVI